MRVLVTGANGFVGTALCTRLAADGAHVVAAVRRSAPLARGASPFIIGDFHDPRRWDTALRDVTGVVHLAARVHMMEDTASHPLEEFRRVNVESTAIIARRAAAAGVQRFVYVSSVKVHGEERDRPYAEHDPANPQSPYGQSKWEAELALRAIETETGMAVTIIRPPLVYGPGVRANFLTLMKLIHAHVPLPFGATRNRRSLVFVDNLTDALARCLTHSGAARRTFLISDGEDVSTGELIRHLADAMHVRAMLLPVPAGLLWMAGRIAGKQAAVARLVGSLRVDSGAIREHAEWTPPYSLRDGLAVTAAHYVKSRAR